MRTFEILLATANGLTLLLAAYSFFHRTRWLAYFACAAVLLSIAQIAVEGQRWELYPAYALTSLSFMIWLLPALRRKRRAPKQARAHPFIAAAAFVLAFIALVFSIALPVALPVFGFPSPAGPYAIGTVTYHWSDTARPEVFGPAPRKSRAMMVQIWYPAVPKASPHRANYVNDADTLSAALGRLHGLPAFMFSHLKYVDTNAVPSVPISPKQPDYPVLIFLEGITGYRQMNTFMIEELASQGYIVVAIDQPYVAASVRFPGGRVTDGLSKDQMNPLIQQSISPSAIVPTLNSQAFASGIIPYLAEDVSFVIDRLTALDRSGATNVLRGKLDMERVGIFGVSLGGIVVAEACRMDPRLKACLVMDAPMSATVLQSGLRQPAMWITRDAKTMQSEGWAEADIFQHQATMRGVFARSRADAYFVGIAGLFHANLTDVPLYSPLTSCLGITGTIDSQRAHAIVNAYSLAFFDLHLRGKRASLLGPSAERFSEVTVETKGSLRANPSPRAAD